MSGGEAEREPMLVALQGRTALVAGASRGIGLAVARGLVRAGAWVGMIARDPALLARAADEVGGHAIAADVSQAADVNRVVAFTLELLGGDAPDLLVNAAGSFALAPLAETEPAMFDAQLAVNLRGPFLMMRAFLPPMLARGSGHIVSVGSIAGRVALPGNAGYAASKFGLRGLHEVLTEEVRGTGVRATLIEPAATDTSLWDAIATAAIDGLPERAAMLRADDVARAILFAAAQPCSVEIPLLSIRSTR